MKIAAFRHISAEFSSSHDENTSDTYDDAPPQMGCITESITVSDSYLLYRTGQPAKAAAAAAAVAYP